MSQKQPKKRWRRTLVLVIAAALVALGAYLARFCGKGFGLGAGFGLGDEGETSPTARSAEPAQSAVPSAAAPPSDAGSSTTTIIVRGDRCDDANCETACKDATGDVVIDARRGSHKDVEELERCLKARGLSVSIRTD